MMNVTPMLACHGGFDPGPGLSAVLLGAVAVWGLALLAVIPNVFLSCRAGKSPAFKQVNLGFLAVYVLLTALLFSGTVFDGDMLLGIGLIFAVPTMSAGHFIYLYMGWRREKKAKQPQK
jgi:hypothetical protein